MLLQNIPHSYIIACQQKIGKISKIKGQLNGGKQEVTKVSWTGKFN